MDNYNIIDKRLTRLEDVFDKITDLTLEIQKIAIETKHMREDFNKLSDEIKLKQDDLTCRIKEIETKPMKRLDTVISCVITCVVSLIIGAIAVYIGLK